MLSTIYVTGRDRKLVEKARRMARNYEIMADAVGRIMESVFEPRWSFWIAPCGVSTSEHLVSSFLAAREAFIKKAVEKCSGITATVTNVEIVNVKMSS